MFFFSLSATQCVYVVRIRELCVGVAGTQKFWIRNMGENKVSDKNIFKSI